MSRQWFPRETQWFASRNTSHNLQRWGFDGVGINGKKRDSKPCWSLSFSLTQSSSTWASQMAIGSGRSPGGGHGNPFQYSCLENPMDRGAWWAMVHRVAKSRAWQKWLSTHTNFFVWDWVSVLTDSLRICSLLHAFWFSFRYHCTF